MSAAQYCLSVTEPVHLTMDDVSVDDVDIDDQCINLYSNINMMCVSSKAI